ncbi:hypothetical protein BV22DRAFT_1066690 [Leucogyrophana mollusca]|uniref:Uncharacterized protein n=1 Tax=Leucogyrophana mollusca TaxID=85980 RepID=A0ACB8BIW1_9AGAM|nr:hypothetical protein BV22DRAFT_1066690 [Leucogyrophana mollusca]
MLTPSTSISTLIFLMLLCRRVTANTEIINLVASEENKVVLPSVPVGNWPTLHYAHNELRWAIHPAPLDTNLSQLCESDAHPASPESSPFLCPHELWVALDLDDQNWRAYSKFTLRLSWPASSPADFLIEIHTPESLSTRLSTTTRQKYARIRVVDAGVLTPGPHLKSPEFAVEPVPFILILEQLYLGILPASLLPTVCFLVPVLLAAAMTVPYITRYLDGFVRQAREELGQSKAVLEKKKR